MVKMSENEEFLGPEMVRNGDLLVIVTEGVFLTADETPFKRPAFQIGVNMPNGSRKTWTMNKTTRRRLVAAYGDESKDWVGKKVRIECLTQNVRGELKSVVYGYPVAMIEERSGGNITKTAETRLTEEEVLKRFEGLDLTEEDKRKYVENLKAAGLL